MRYLESVGLAVTTLCLCLSSLVPVAYSPAIAQVTLAQSRKEANSLFQLGTRQFENSQFQSALVTFQKALAIWKDAGNLGAQGDVLLKLGAVHEILGQYPQALKHYQQAEKLFVKLGEKENRTGALSGLGIVYLRTGQYSRAIAVFQQARSLIPDAAVPLNGIGLAYGYLGQYEESLKFHQQALAIRKKFHQRSGEATSLLNIGLVYSDLNQPQTALDYYQQALAIYEQTKYLTGQARSFTNIGETYNLLGQHTEAMKVLQAALKISKDLKDSRGQGIALDNIGTTYGYLGQNSQATEAYEQAILIRRNIGDRAGEANTLSNIGNLLAKEKQTELAIVFFKQSVTVYESIRKDLQTLTEEQQETYTKRVASAYRSLADLLLEQGRVLEAQQVLELLKAQELQNYTRDARDQQNERADLLTPVEAPVVTPFNDKIALGQQLTVCESQKPPCKERDQLLGQRQVANDSFNQKVSRLRLLVQQPATTDPASLRQSELTVATQKVVKSQPKTILIYPLVLEDKLWLVYGTQAGKEGVVFDQKLVPVSRKQLGQAVLEFRQLLSKDGDRQQLERVSQQLYQWLIAPLRQELDANGIQHLVFALDRSTRYIPMSALFDGTEYLTQRFTISTILSAGLTDMSDRLALNVTENSVLGLGLSNAVGNFNSLPNVVNEMDGIIRTDSKDAQGIYPGLKLLNKAFTREAFKRLIEYRILHIATHGKFISGDPDSSFLVLGDGSLLKISEIKSMSDLGAIHLVVLSACETARGGQDRDGIEVSGISYYFLTSGAKSVIASLWLVNDASTSLLMQQFYKNLATGKMTKAEALRQAQLTLLQGKVTAEDAPKRTGTAELTVTASGDRAPRPANFSHPYYWAPFILIGNSL